MKTKDSRLVYYHIEYQNPSYSNGLANGLNTYGTLKRIIEVRKRDSNYHCTIVWNG